MIPSPWVAAVLALASFRVFRLVAWDDLPVIVRLRRRLTGASVRRTGSLAALHGMSNDRVDEDIVFKRPVLAKFIECPWCCGFWIGVVVYVAWAVEPKWTLYVTAPLALNVVVALLARFDSD